MMKIKLAKQALDEIRSHAEEDYPNECCGFFFGSEKNFRKMTHIKRVKNIQSENRKRRFRIDPDEYRRAERFADQHELDFLGIYHSHPEHPAIPSEHDRSVALPFFSYIIVSVTGGKSVRVRSWRLNESQQFDEEELEELPEIEKVS